MKRRSFIQSVAAVLTLPANPLLSLQPAAASLPAVAAVPAQARSWAVYMSTLHGECTPQALQVMMNISPIDAKKYVTQLIADGVINQNPILQRSVSELVKTDENSVFDRVKKRLEMKNQAASEAKNIEPPEDQKEASSEISELDIEMALEDEPQTLDEEIEVQMKIEH